MPYFHTPDNTRLFDTDLHASHGSAACQAIVRLRTDSSQGDTVLVEGVPGGHRGTDLLPAFYLYAQELTCVPFASL
jgi:hypothetical protein